MAEAEPSSKAQKPCRSGADIPNFTEGFVPRDPVAFAFAQNSGPSGFVRRVAGDQVEHTGVQHAGKITQVGTYRKKTVRRKPPTATLLCICATACSCTSTAQTFRGAVFSVPEPQGSHNPAARAEIAGQILSARRGEIRKQKRIGPEFMLWRNAQLYPLPKRLKGVLEQKHPLLTEKSRAARR